MPFFFFFFFKRSMKGQITRNYAHNMRTKHFQCFSLAFINMKQTCLRKVIKTSTKILNVVMACSTDVDVQNVHRKYSTNQVGCFTDHHTA